MRLKLLEWIHRYIKAEIVAFIGAFSGGLIIHYLFGNPIATALGATWGENLGYYGEILYADIQEKMGRDKKLTLRGFASIVRDMVIEFGPGEYLDSFFIRPFAMYFFLDMTGNTAAGLFLGKLCADVAFYIPVLTGYEFRKKYFRD